MTTTMREGTALTRPLPTEIVAAIWSSCGCHAALVINHDGTRELAHEIWCPIGTAEGAVNGTYHAGTKEAGYHSGTRTECHSGTDGGTNNGTR